MPDVPMRSATTRCRGASDPSAKLFSSGTFLLRVPESLSRYAETAAVGKQNKNILEQLTGGFPRLGEVGEATHLRITLDSRVCDARRGSAVERCLSRETRRGF